MLHRPKDKPLITVILCPLFLGLALSMVGFEYGLCSFLLIQVSNHVASVDDPFIIAALLPPRVLLDSQNLRWTLCATDRCFKNPVTSAFFRSVKVLPVSRGDGIYQKVITTSCNNIVCV